MRRGRLKDGLLRSVPRHMLGLYTARTAKLWRRMPSIPERLMHDSAELLVGTREAVEAPGSMMIAAA
jgi:hypothetical protein